ncbi:putative lipoprotein YgdR [Enterobacter cloacae]|uniref:YgdI/YgdR family lipoprotein n=1 Tax=Enterobacter hormaechei TaxID=158836 RepID=UPI001D29C994|nr:YgdI/YgdR family lipoprotein [Enterobacter hormaechei subsp. steigerwaltii]CAF2572523.1 putative lipoprotein YgdR [Enterobacter cloacae]CAH5294131.1 putative lipoprotein YgdR [Enterobacter cloacae]
MKKVVTLSLLTAVTIFTAGCVKHSYSIVTQDGRTIISEVKPKETSAGLVGYVDANGGRQQINRAEVKEITQIR